MINLGFTQILETIHGTETAYHKLTVVAGMVGAGKTRLLNQIATNLRLPLINLNLLLSKQLLSLTQQQRKLKAEEIATEIIDEHIQSGICLDNTELLFDSTLRLNPLVFLRELSRNRLVVASWNGMIYGGDLRYGYPSHPDFFSQASSGFPIVAVADGEYQLHLTS